MERRISARPMRGATGPMAKAAGPVVEIGYGRHDMAGRGDGSHV